MNGPERLSLGNDRFVSELLNAARDLDAPSPDAAGRIALAIAQRGHLRFGQRRGMWGVLGGLGALGVLSASLLLGGRRYELPQPTISSVASAFTIRVVEEPVTLRNDHPLPCADSSSVEALATPVPPSHAAARRPLLTLAVAAPPKDEIAVIDQARAAVRGGDATGALAALARHAAEFPKPRFGEEAAALRVEALALRGDLAATDRTARAFLAAYPRSAYARRVRSVAGIDE